MGFFDRLANAWKIFKLSFGLLKRDKSLIILPILMFFVSIILIIFFFNYIFVGALFFENPLSQKILDNKTNFYIILIIFVFLFVLLITFLSAAQSWMVYEVFNGRNTTVRSGLKRAFKKLLDILILVFVSWVIAIFVSWLRGKGKGGEMSGNFISYLTGLAGKLVLPAMIITERNFKESIMQLKDSIKAIPEIATYEIGIRPLTTSVFFIGVILALLFGFSFGFIVGLILFIIWICSIILISVYVNETYYTLLYLTLIEKKKIKGLNLYIK